MCLNCYRDYGSPTKLPQNWKDIVESIAAVYEESCAGGNLHVALDDWNLESKWFRVTWDFIDYPPTTAEYRCSCLMRSITELERAAVLAKYEGFYGT